MAAAAMEMPMMTSLLTPIVRATFSAVRSAVRRAFPASLRALSMTVSFLAAVSAAWRATVCRREPPDASASSVCPRLSTTGRMMSASRSSSTPSGRIRTGAAQALSAMQASSAREAREAVDGRVDDIAWMREVSRDWVRWIGGAESVGATKRLRWSFCTVGASADTATSRESTVQSAARADATHYCLRTLQYGPPNGGEECQQKLLKIRLFQLAANGA